MNNDFAVFVLITYSSVQPKVQGKTNGLFKLHMSLIYVKVLNTFPSCRSPGHIFLMFWTYLSQNVIEFTEFDSRHLLNHIHRYLTVQGSIGENKNLIIDPKLNGKPM